MKLILLKAERKERGSKPALRKERSVTERSKAGKALSSSLDGELRLGGGEDPLDKYEARARMLTRQQVKIRQDRDDEMSSAKA